MAWYRVGTVGVTNGSATVALSGGNALANIFPGDSFLGPDGRAYEVALATSATSFTLATAYQGATATGQPYAIQPTGSTGALRLLNDQVSDLVTNYQTGRDAWASAPASTLKGRKSSGAGDVENLTPADVLALLSGGTSGALTGTERLPALQGTSAVGLTINQLLSRAAGQVIPLEIGGQRVATVTANGLGVGIPGPERGLHVGGATESACTIRVTGNGTETYGSVEFQAGGNIFRLRNPGGGLMFTQVGIADRGMFDAGGNFLIAQSAANTNPTDKTPGITLSASGLAKFTRNGHALALHRTDSVGTVAAFAQGTSEVGTISVTASSTAYNTSSDYRLKNEEGEISDEEALAFIEASRPIWFSWLATGERVDGYLAHEVQQLIPWAVTGEKDAVEEIGDATGYRETDPETGVPIIASKETLTGITRAEAPEGYVWTKTGARPVYQGIDQSKLVPRLNAGLKAAVRLIRSLEGTVSALEQRIEALEAAA